MRWSEHSLCLQWVRIGVIVKKNKIVVISYRATSLYTLIFDAPFLIVKHIPKLESHATPGVMVILVPKKKRNLHKNNPKFKGFGYPGAKK